VARRALFMQSVMNASQSLQEQIAGWNGARRRQRDAGDGASEAEVAYPWCHDGGQTWTFRVVRGRSPTAGRLSDLRKRVRVDVRERPQAALAVWSGMGRHAQEHQTFDVQAQIGRFSTPWALATRRRHPVSAVCRPFSVGRGGVDGRRGLPRERFARRRDLRSTSRLVPMAPVGAAV
jgi:hypothetical protein